MTFCPKTPQFLRPVLFAALLGMMPAAGLAQSSDVAARVAAQLTAQGYHQIDVSRSLLGKVVVRARGDGHTREIVIDPRSGELLRDLIRGEGGRNGGTLANVGRPSRDSDRDDRDDNDDDDDDDDSDNDDDSDDDGNDSDSDDD